MKVLSTSDAGADLLVAVDRMVLSGRRVFGWGWAAHQRQAVRSVRLRVEGDSWQVRLPGGFGLWRRDVEESHPELVNARTSGFVLTGYAPEANARSLYLELELEDGTWTQTDVTEAVDKRNSRRNKLRLFLWMARSIWRRATRGDFVGILRRAKAQSYAARPLDQMNVLEDMLRASSGSRPACLVIDNNMGGGSNEYRRSMIAGRLDSGQAVLLCTYNLPILEYRVHLYRPGHGEQVFRIPSFLPLERLIRTGLIAELFVNSPVSFDEPLVLAEWLARMRMEHPGVRLTVTAHDYFTVCPSFVLLNADGRYCGVPDLSVCADCLRRHQGSLVALSPRTEIGPWRALWGRCLQAADEVRCFSEETRRLLARAYPTLDPARVSVVPHVVEFTPLRAPRIDPRAPLVIGIVGDISFQKGARLVQDLVDLVDRSHPDVRVVVIGSLDVAHTSKSLRVTGAYRHDDLVELIEANGINMFLFSSIWPETFSYVVAELMLLRVPIVAFDLGAPAERLRGYREARLCREVSAAAALETLIGFHRELALGEASAA